MFLALFNHVIPYLTRHLYEKEQNNFVTDFNVADNELDSQ
jgi:hypothetical protein